MLVTRDGWVKRQREIKDPAATRLREGDAVLAVVAGSTKASVVFFSNYGTAYTSRIIDVPATTGYGEPIQKLFKLKDGESIVAMASLDPRVTGKLAGRRGALPRDVRARGELATATRSRSASRPFVEPSTRSGRRYRTPVGGRRRSSASQIVQRRRDGHRGVEEAPRAPLRRRAR